MMLAEIEFRLRLGADNQKALGELVDRITKFIEDDLAFAERGGNLTKLGRGDWIHSTISVERL